MNPEAALRWAAKALSARRNEACRKLANFNRQSFEGKQAFDTTLETIVQDDHAIDALEALLKAYDK